MAKGRILIVIFPAYGAINPSIELARNLIRAGSKVSILTALSFQNRIPKSITSMEDLAVTFFADGYDDGIKKGVNIEEFFSNLRVYGSKAVTELIHSFSREGSSKQPFNHLIYTMGLTWAAQLAKEFDIPSSPLWVQPATVFDIYYYYFIGGYGDAIRDCVDSGPLSAIQLPGLPLLTTSDLPTFLLPYKPLHQFGISSFKEVIEMLNAETDVTILVNTFEALEQEAMRATPEKFKMVPIGPLVHSSFLTNDLPSDGGISYLDWLNTKLESSVVYVSFGSGSYINPQQIEKIADGLLKCGRPFLWVLREAANWDKEEGRKPISCIEELEKQGLIVPWCSQAEVLNHPSLGCFLTHCGWNSTLETIVSGVPIVAYPQFTDQTTNAKILEDVVKSGVRVKLNEEEIATGDEIGRCIEVVMGDGERGQEMRRHAKRWSSLAKEAIMEGGSSFLNLKAFLEKNLSGK